MYGDVIATFISFIFLRFYLSNYFLAIQSNPLFLSLKQAPSLVILHLTTRFLILLWPFLQSNSLYSSLFPHLHIRLFSVFIRKFNPLSNPSTLLSVSRSYIENSIPQSMPIYGSQQCTRHFDCSFELHKLWTWGNLAKTNDIFSRYELIFCSF